MQAKPSHLSIYFTIPVSVGDFDYLVNNDIRCDFLNHVVFKNKLKFCKHVAKPYQFLWNACKNHDVITQTRCTLKDFHQAIANTQQDRIILLFGHRVGNGIEFWDGVYSADQIVSGVTETFKGIIDLNVCSPLVLYEKLSKKIEGVTMRRDSFVHFIVAFYFYAAVVELLASRSLTYHAAIEVIVNSFKQN